jgi:hypothetical protein
MEKGIKKNMEPNKELQNPIGTISTTNPALQGLFDNANKVLTDFQSRGGQITPEIQQRIQSINDFETQKTSAIASARSAAEAKDAAGLNAGVTGATTAEKSQQEIINSLLGDLKTARESTVTALAPNEQEKQLRSRLNTLRTERQLLPLELRQEGISAQGIGGRQIEDERVRAIQESNLLAEIGLEQDARKMKVASAEQQADYITQDIDLRMKIQDALKKQEEDVVNQARTLRKDSISALADIVDSFSGLSFADMDVQTQADVLETAKQFGISPSLISGALENAKRQQVFDNAIKTTKGTEKPATAAQQTLSGYAVRIEQANPTLKELESKISKMSYLNYKLQSALPSSFQSSDFQQYDQAARNSINAVLRRESGAAIAASEFENARQQYLPVAGDSPQVLKQKEINRSLVFENFKKGSGGAYSSVSELLGGGAGQQQQQDESYITKDGTEYVKGEDGLFYPL